MDSESSENIYSILKTSFLGLFPCLGKAQSSQSENFQKNTTFEISIFLTLTEKPIVLPRERNLLAYTAVPLVQGVLGWVLNKC